MSELTGNDNIPDSLPGSSAMESTAINQRQHQQQEQDQMAPQLYQKQSPHIYLDDVALFLTSIPYNGESVSEDIIQARTATLIHGWKWILDKFKDHVELLDELTRKN